MPSNWQTFPVEFRGGLISNMSPLQQGTNAVGSATFLQNFEPSKEGGYKKILGFEKYISGQVSGTGDILGIKTVEGGKVVVARSSGSGTAYYINSGESWSLIDTAANVGNKVRSAVFNFNGDKKAFFVDGINAPAVFDTSTDNITFLTSAPSDVIGAKHVAVFQDAVFVAKGNKVTFSVPYDESDYSVANGAGTINVGSDITGLTVFRDTLFVFSRDKIQRINGTSVADFVLNPVAESIGCIDGDTIQEVGGDVMFLGPDGLRLLSATERFNDFGLAVASSPIEKDMLRLINQNQSFSSVVIRGKAQYRLFAYSPTLSSTASEGLIATKFSDQGAESVQWATTKGIKVSASDSSYVGSGEVVLFGNSDGYIYRMETGASFDGENIEAIYNSPFMPINDPQIRKTFYKLTLSVDIQGTFDATVSLDLEMFKVKNYNSTVNPPAVRLQSSSAGVFIYGASNTLYGTALYGAELDKVYNTQIIGSGNTLSFRVEDNSTNPSFSLDTAIFEYSNNDRI